MDQDVKDLLQAAEDYREFMETKLGIDIHTKYWGDYTEANSTHWEQIEMMFLIPQAYFLGEGIVDVINLVKARQLAQLSHGRDDLPDYKSEFEELRDKVQQSGITNEVTPIQRKLLEQYYFVIYPES